MCTYLFFVHNFYMKYFLFGLLCLVTLIKFVKPQKAKAKLKTKRVLFLAKPKYLVFTSICLKLNFLSLKQSKIKSLKMLKQVDHIISCVLYSRPTLYTKTINFNLLKNYGINIDYPLLVIDNVDNKMLRYLVIAQRYVKFNIVLKSKVMSSFKKYKKLLNYNILCPNCSYELFANIMRLNCYVKNKFKIIINKEYFIIKNNHNTINIKNFDSKSVNLNDIFIEFRNINQQYYILKIYNKSESYQNLKLNYSINLPIEYYKFIKISRGIFIYNILKNKSYYILNTNNITFNYSNKYELPFISFSKILKLKANQTKQIIFYVGDKNLSKQQIEQNIQNHIKSLQDLFCCKVEILDKSLQFLFNVYLPKQIEHYGKDTKQSIIKNDFNQVLIDYKQKRLDCYGFYVWLKEVYFGIKETSTHLYIKPLCKDDFAIVYKFKDRDICVKIKHENNKNYMILDGVKYNNFLVIPKNKLSTIKDVLLVI